MGEAKTKKEIKEERRKARKEALEFSRTIPIRVVKGALGFVLAIPMLLIFFTVRSFWDNNWPWYME